MTASKISSFRIAGCLLREPKILGSLVLAPLLFSLYLAVVELLLVGLVAKTFAPPTRDDFDKSFEETRVESTSWRFLYGETEQIEQIHSCTQSADSAPELNNVAPKPCTSSSVRLALISPIATQPMIDYLHQMFNGVAEELILCQKCSADLEIYPVGTRPRIIIRSLRGLALYDLLHLRQDFYQHNKKVAGAYNILFGPLGEGQFWAPGFRSAVPLADIIKNSALCFNFMFFLAIGLFLTIWAHRRVLDYFAKNGVLLPLVAASGSKQFYPAMWWLTLVRAVAFFAAALPLCLLYTNSLLKQGIFTALFEGNYFELAIWIATVCASLTATVLLVSSAELKQRADWKSLLYKYVPLLLFLLGAAIWILSFFLSDSAGLALRSALLPIPLVGVVALMLAPVFKPLSALLVLHFLAALILCLVLVRKNSQWFAAHLDEL